MRKVIMTAIILVLMAGMVHAEPGKWGECVIKNEPLGWSGWTWGTLFEDVKGYLNVAGVFSAPFLRDLKNTLYTRQGQINIYNGAEWEETYYIFEEGRLCAVSLVPIEWGKRWDTIGYYGLSGGWTRTGETSDNTVAYSWGKGKHASALYIAEFNGKDRFIIGDAKTVSMWIDKFMGSHQYYVEWLGRQ
mgnify:CR=1 FL=1